MAESLKSKYNRYARGEFTPGEAKTIIGYFVLDKGLDIATFGAINRFTGKTLVSAVSRLGPLAGRAAVGTASVAGRSLIGAAAPIVGSAAFPVAAGAALGYGALQTSQGQQLLEMAEERGRMDRIRLEQGLADFGVGARDTLSAIADLKAPIVGVRRSSVYNKAVSKGMKALKKSTSYGKKGILSTPKKAFGFVARTVSKLRRGKKVPSKGASGVVKRSLPGIKKITVRKP